MGLTGLGLVYRAHRESPAEGAVEVEWKLRPDSTNHSKVQAPPPACSLRYAVERHFLLKKKFRFSEPVFQTRDTLTPESWSELIQREPPYGWSGLDQHVVADALSLLTSSDLWEGPEGACPEGACPRCVRCAVVGNGGILRGSKQGRVIDEHDYVFRVNGAVIKGFEDDVGTKTSFYGFTTNTMKNSLRRYHGDGFTSIPQTKSLKYIFIPSQLRDYVMLSSATRGRTVPSGPDKGDGPWRYFGKTPPSGFRMLHPQFIRYITHSFLESRLMFDPRTKHMFMPSTGALMLLTALHTCDQVSAFGFITENYAAFSDHYYDSHYKPLKFFSNHDMRLELKLWKSLHKQKIISLYQRKA